MNRVVEEFYRSNGIPEVLFSRKDMLFSKNPDIEREFVYWIENHEYLTENPIEIEGYTAEKLSQLRSNLDGEGVFLMLVELRENPEKAKLRIHDGFKRK